MSSKYQILAKTIKIMDLRAIERQMYQYQGTSQMWVFKISASNLTRVGSK